MLLPADKIMEAAGFVLLAALWLLTGSCYNHLPGTIPIHFNEVVQALHFERKSTIWVLPLITTAMFSGLIIFNRFPHIISYPIQITAENTLLQYTRSTKMIR